MGGNKLEHISDDNEQLEPSICKIIVQHNRREKFNSTRNVQSSLFDSQIIIFLFVLVISGTQDDEGDDEPEDEGTPHPHRHPDDHVLVHTVVTDRQVIIRTPGI